MAKIGTNHSEKFKYLSKRTQTFLPFERLFSSNSHYKNLFEEKCFNLKNDTDKNKSSNERVK